MQVRQRNCPIVLVVFGLLASVMSVIAAAKPPGGTQPFSFTGPVFGEAAVRYSPGRCGEHRSAIDAKRPRHIRVGVYDRFALYVGATFNWPAGAEAQSPTQVDHNPATAYARRGDRSYTCELSRGS